MTDYEPTEVDISWFKSLGAMLTPGGIWGCPEGESTYTLDNTKKEITLIRGDIEDETVKRTKKVAEAAGWTFIHGAMEEKQNG